MPMTLDEPGHSEIVVRKSRFIGCVEPVADRQAAIVRVEALHRRHPGATHVCWALLAGRQSAAVDDGEPSGTAGQPMLNVLRHHDLEGVLASSVRYFGGVKLGAGGLVRAYTDSVARAMKGAHKVVLESMCTFKCELPYSMEGLLRQELARTGARLESVEHRESVSMQFSLPESAAEALQQRLREPGQGQLEWARL